ncbi:MAG: glycosyltransferase family 4 protein [Bacteroides sp.]|nr:glycosyltransferase family 4 protein [Bacteroides sp.]
MAANDVCNLASEFGVSSNITYLKYKSTNKFYRLAFDIPFLIKKYKIDYAHFQYMLPLFKQCKEIVTIHDVLFLDYPQYFTWKYKVLYNFLIRLAAHRAELLLTVSEYSKNRIIKYYGIKKDEIFVISNGVGEKRVNNKLPKVLSSPFILFVSRIEERKNHLGLIKAFVKSELWKNGINLILAGRKTACVPKFDVYMATLPEVIKQHIILSVPSDEELEMLYTNCLFFVYPSFAEGFGIPPLEAAITHKRVTCADVTAMQDFKELGFTMFSPDNIDDLSAKMILPAKTKENETALKQIATKVLKKI